MKGYHDCLDLSEVQLISGKNINIISIYQDLGTTGASYFTARQAQIDVVEALSLAGQLNQPSRTPVYFANAIKLTNKFQKKEKSLDKGKKMCGKALKTRLI
ncbi:MAG: DUF1906 domain-containing protein, partial [Oscillospiraceae bacterium]|nr:DUF1906 domain-containing protein [Oscillospiraceae bacterium]MCI9581814.1 DUF1906 domain-containing protein [Oscillospiraceae bacterium]